eukprot:GHRQ01002990.1.p2 GENE.GHRQ01002990.1~~GHRQ01002990.1.p2  ORF type:complete len:233 (+),score=64.67 GHRQ01002990.1:673-1371(+)
MSDQGCGLVGQVVAPGDAVQALPPSGSVRIGPGLRAEGSYVVAQKCGVVRQTRNGKLWLESKQKRYIPAEEDLVVGVITDRRGENFVVDIGGPFTAQLPMLSFEGATRRNRPNLAAGDLVYARVTTANRDMDPELSCVDAQGKSSGFGALKGGFVLQCGLGHARALLARPPAPVLAAVGAKLQFELAVGLNGRVWLDSSSCATTVKIANLLQHAQGVAAADVQQWVAAQLQQ